MTVSNEKEWFKDLDISPKGKPTGIDKIDDLSTRGICYCIITSDNVVEQVDVYNDGKKVHYKKFGYDNLGRVIENAMYSPDEKDGWHIVDDIWYYEYDPASGYRTKKIMKMPGASTAREILYNKDGNRISDKVVSL